MTNSDDTIRIKDSDETMLIQDSSQTIKTSRTQKTGTSTIIPSGLSDGLRILKDRTNTCELNGVKYELLKKISESTTEAQIFLIKKGKEKFVLKYYYPFVKPKIDIIEKLRSFSHPDIVGVIDFGYFEDRFFEILSYADMGSLADQIPIQDVKRIKQFVGEIANALEHCHKNGIIHRDIKPSNIFIRNKKKNDVVVGDFGIASIIDNETELRRTNIFQTPIYAAPEYKMTLRGETVISKAVDYYALGITVWEMWSGKLPPAGMDDLDFLRLMFEDIPPLPAGMNDEIAYLIKGLTTRDYKKRWGFDEIKKWLNGDPVELFEEKIHIKTTGFDFGESEDHTRLFAQTPKELAKLIQKYPELGRKHLYRGTIKDWLKTIGNQRLLIEISDITDYKFKDDEETGTEYAVYILDRNIPFKGIHRTECSTKEQLAEELRESFSKYKSLLVNPNHRFYLYLLSKNMPREVELFRHYYKTLDEETALNQIIYSLLFSVNPNTPFVINDKDGISFSVKTAKDIADVLLKNPGLCKNLHENNNFKVWLSFKDKDLLSDFDKYVKKYKKSKNLRGLLPYLFDPDKGYVGLDGRECNCLEDLGQEIYDHHEDYVKILKNTDSNIYCYFEAKGFAGEKEFYNKVFDLELASDKAAVYNDNIAIWKIVKGSGNLTPFVVSGIELNAPEELLQHYPRLRDELFDQLDNKDSFINAWLAVFFHEAPLNDDGSMYLYYREDYEERLNQYLLFLKELDPSLSLVKKYEDAEQKISTIKRKLDNYNKSVKTEVILTYLFPLVSAMILLGYTIIVGNNHLPGNIFDIGSWYFGIWAFGTAAWLLWDGFQSNNVELSTGCIGGPIIGIILGVIAYYIFFLVITVPILLALVLAFGYYLLFKKLSEFKDMYIHELDNAEAEINYKELEYLAYRYTFGKLKSIKISASEKLNNIKEDRKTFRMKAWGVSLGFAIIVIVILTVLVTLNPNINF